MTTSGPTHSDALHFPVIDGELQVGGILLSRLAARVGHTPFYAYDRKQISRRVAELRAALPAAMRIHYAIKANPLPALISHMAGSVDGLDVSSANELKAALDSGMAPEHISFAGPGKQPAELEQAVAAGILLNIESFREVRQLAEISARTGWPARVAVRINPDFELKSSGMKMGGGPKQFGVDANQVPGLLDEIGKLGLSFEGFHIYAGSQNLKADAIADAQWSSYELALRLAEHAPGKVKSLNLGGGFGIPYFPGEKPLELAPIAEALNAIADKATGQLPGARLVLELGRYLVGEAGIYVTRIIDKKISRGHTYLITDGGLNHHLAASGNLGQVIRKNYPVAIGNRMNQTTGGKSMSIVGPLCTPLDTLAENVEFACVEPGDLVVIFQSGAYGATASPGRFLGHPEAVEVLI